MPLGTAFPASRCHDTVTGLPCLGFPHSHSSGSTQGLALCKESNPRVSTHRASLGDWTGGVPCKWSFNVSGSQTVGRPASVHGAALLSWQHVSWWAPCPSCHPWSMQGLGRSLLSPSSAFMPCRPLSSLQTEGGKEGVVWEKWLILRCALSLSFFIFFPILYLAVSFMSFAALCVVRKFPR